MEVNAYAKAYGTTGKSLAAGVSRKKKVRQDIFHSIKEYKQNFFESTKNSQKDFMIKVAKANALSAIEKREILRAIISGEAIQEKVVVIDAKTYIVTHSPSIADKIKAIQIDN